MARKKRHRSKDSEPPSYFTWLFAESRNRIFIFAASVALIIFAVLIAIFIIPEKVTVYLYQAEPGEAEAFQELIQDFQMSTGKELSLWNSSDYDRFDRIARGDSAPMVLAFHPGRNSDSLSSLFNTLNPEIEKNLSRSSFPKAAAFSSPKAFLLCVNPLGILSPDSDLDFSRLRSLKQLVATKDEALFWPGIKVAGADDRSLLDFVSALVLSLWGVGAYDKLAQAQGNYTPFETLLDLNLNPSEVEGAEVYSLRMVLDLLRTWMQEGVMDAGFLALSKADLQWSLSRKEKAYYVLPASEFLSRKAQAEDAEIWQYMLFPPYAAGSAYFLSGPALYVARSFGKSRYDDAELERTADQFITYLSEAKTRKSFRQGANLIPAEASEEEVLDAVKTVPLRLAGDIPLRSGLWFDAINRQSNDSWQYGSHLGGFCRNLRSYLQSPSPNDELSDESGVSPEAEPLETRAAGS